MKLFRVTVDCLEATTLTIYFGSNATANIRVWSKDGNLTYLDFKHIWIFLFALSLLIFLWLPNTLFILLAQVLRKVSGYKFLKWVVQLSPVYDAHFAPLKHQHQYWFGMLLVV